jgi:PAS domain-containing protein
MELFSQPLIGDAVMAGVLAGSVLLILLLASEARAEKRTPAQGTSSPIADDADAVVFLFSGRDLVQFTDTAAHLLQDAAYQEEAEATPQIKTDWDKVRDILKHRFPNLPDRPRWPIKTGNATITAAQPDDTGQLFLEWWDGHIRLTLTERTPDAPTIHPPAPPADEAGWLRQAVTGAPYPIWQSDRKGQVLWANTAYRDLVARFKAVPQPDADCPALFDIPYDDNSDSATCRLSVTPVGSVQPYWFDVRALRLDSGWMNYATDVNAVVNAEIAQRNFVQTLTKTFAQLSIGLAIFDRKRQLALFNPALIDLTSLSAEFLSARPNLLSFFDRLRDRQMIPEPKNYRSWRDQIADLVAAADNGQYLETWSLPSGLTYRISGRPHPDGAVAFLFEDISAEISLTRRFRSQLELGQSVLNTLEQSIAVFSPTGVLAFSNTAYRRMWGIDPDSSFADISVTEASRQWQAGSMPTPVWGDLRDFVVQFGERADWQAEVILRDGRAVTCQVVPMAGGATLVLFQPEDTVSAALGRDLLHSPA